MKALPKGTKVRVVKKGDSKDYHGFKVGTIATSLGQLFDGNPLWQDFTDEEGFTQYLQAQHFELVDPVVEDTVKVIVLRKETDELLDKEVDSDLPTKVVYAIVNKDNEIVSCKVDRDKARETKAILGGKKKGVRIFQYVATKEIR